MEIECLLYINKFILEMQNRMAASHNKLILEMQNRMATSHNKLMLEMQNRIVIVHYKHIPKRERHKRHTGKA